MPQHTSQLCVFDDLRSMQLQRARTVLQDVQQQEEQQHEEEFDRA